MRIKSVIVSKYRIHNSTKVEFDPRLTLITGPNESGKTTLVEAIHRALFLRSKVNGEVREKMKSCWGEPPEVTLELEVGNKNVSMKKMFWGTKGECNLHITNEVDYFGDDAEQRLAEILKVKEPIDGRGAQNALAQRWSHLWVWQGESGQSPTGAVAEQQDTLVQRLQAKGGAAVTQSDLDAHVIRIIQDQRNSWYIDKGKLRVQSDLAQAEYKVESARNDLQEKKENLLAIENAAVRYIDALQHITEKNQSMRINVSELKKAEDKNQQAEALGRDLEPIIEKQEKILAEIAKSERITQELNEAHRAYREAETILAPSKLNVDNLTAECEACRDVFNTSEEVNNQARKQATIARRWQNALTDYLQALEQKLKIAKLKADAQKIEDNKKTISKVKNEIIKIPQICSIDIIDLQRRK